MILILKADADGQEVAALYEDICINGCTARDVHGECSRRIEVTGDTENLPKDMFDRHGVVERVIQEQQSHGYSLAARRTKPQGTVVEVAGRRIGGGNFAVIAGPCCVESAEQILSIARDVSFAGAGFLRGGAFKPRTSPYTFSGLGLTGLELLISARRETGLPIVTELISVEHLQVFADNVDIIQIGARNMQNFPLLTSVGRLRKPVLLKRGSASTIDELLMAAEYLMVNGTSDIILCERGIRTFEPSTRNTLDLSAVPVLRHKTHLPVIVDPSHAAGDWRLVEPLALAAVAVGADGLMIEVHNHPELALCDAEQCVTPETFQRIITRANRLRDALRH